MSDRPCKLLFYDLETTGLLVGKHTIHQVAGILEIDGREVDKFDIRVRPDPEFDIDQDALHACNVTEEQIMAYRPAQVGWNELVKRLEKHCRKFDKLDKITLVGYNNVGFDNKMLRAWWRDKYFGSFFWGNSLDVMVLATQHLLHERANMMNFKLGTVADHLGLLPEGVMLHDAMVDVEITRRIYLGINGGVGIRGGAECAIV